MTDIQARIRADARKLRTSSDPRAESAAKNLDIAARGMTPEDRRGPLLAAEMIVAGIVDGAIDFVGLSQSSA